MIGVREVFKGVVVKNWEVLPFESIEFTNHNKLLIKKAVEFYSEYWKDRSNVLHPPEIRKQNLSREIKATKSEAMN